MKAGKRGGRNRGENAGAREVAIWRPLILLSLWSLPIAARPALPVIEGGGGGVSKTQSSPAKVDGAHQDTNPTPSANPATDAAPSLGYVVPRNQDLISCAEDPSLRAKFEKFLADSTQASRANPTKADADSLERARKSFARIMMRSYPPTCFDNKVGPSLLGQLCARLQVPARYWGGLDIQGAPNARVTDRYGFRPREAPENFQQPLWQKADYISVQKAYDKDSLRDLWFLRSSGSAGDNLNASAEDRDGDGIVDLVKLYRKTPVTRNGRVDWETQPFRTLDLKDAATQQRLGLSERMARPRTEQCATLMGNPAALMEHILRAENVDLAGRESNAPGLGNCPEVIAHLVGSADKMNEGLLGAWGGSLDKRCRSVVRQVRATSVSEIEKAFDGHPYTQLPGSKPGMVDRCFAGGVTNARGARVPLGEEDKKVLLAEYRWSMATIATHAKANIEEVGTIDGILGLSGRNLLRVASGRMLQDKLLPGSAEWVDAVRASCQAPADSFENLVKKSRTAVDGLRAIRAARDAVMADRNPIIDGPGGMTTGGDIRNPQRLEQLRQAEEIFVAQAPWLRSDALKSATVGAKPTDQELADGVRRHLLNVREQILRRQKRLLDASRCINGTYDADCAEDFRRTLREMPLVRTHDFFPDAGRESTPQEIAARAYFEQAECRFEHRDVKSELDRKVTHDVALAGVAIGATLVAGPVGAAIVGEAGSASATVVGSQTLLRIVASGAPGMAFAAVDAPEAYKACAEMAERQLSARTERLEPGSRPSCSKYDMTQISASRNYGDCLMKAAVVLADLAPGIPGAVKAVAARSEAVAKVAVEGLDRAVMAKWAQEIARDSKVAGQEARLMSTLDELPRAMLTSKRDVDNVLRSLRELDGLFGGTLKPSEAAKVLGSFDRNQLRAIEGIAGDARQILEHGAADASLTPRRALEEALKARRGLKPGTVSQLLNCIGALAP